MSVGGLVYTVVWKNVTWSLLPCMKNILRKRQNYSDNNRDMLTKFYKTHCVLWFSIAKSACLPRVFLVIPSLSVCSSLFSVVLVSRQMETDKQQPETHQPGQQRMNLQLSPLCTFLNSSIIIFPECTYSTVVVSIILYPVTFIVFGELWFFQCRNIKKCEHIIMAWLGHFCIARWKTNRSISLFRPSVQTEHDYSIFIFCRVKIYIFCFAPILRLCFPLFPIKHATFLLLCFWPNKN